MVSTFEFAENVVGVMIDSDIDDDLMKELIAIVSDKLEDNEKINLFCELRKGNKLTFVAFMRNLKFNLKHLGDFHKIAVVTNHSWIKNALEMKDIVVAANIKIFTNENRLTALNWIAE